MSVSSLNRKGFLFYSIIITFPYPYPPIQYSQIYGLHIPHTDMIDVSVFFFFSIIASLSSLQISGLQSNTFLTDLMTMVEGEVRIEHSGNQMQRY